VTHNTTKNTFKSRRIFAAALLATVGTFAGGAVILAPTASAGAKDFQLMTCVATAESISVKGHSSQEIFISCCHSYGGVVVLTAEGDLDCDFGDASPSSPSSPPLRTAGGHPPTDTTHI